MGLIISWFMKAAVFLMANVTVDVLIIYVERVRHGSFLSWWFTTYLTFNGSPSKG